MSKQILLDTDVWIEIIRENLDALHWLETLDSYPVLSGVAAIESTFGCQSAAELRDVQKKRSRAVIIWPTVEDFREATDRLSQYKLSHGIGILDAVVAATAIRNGLALATFNIKHFRAIPELEIIRPYDR